MQVLRAATTTMSRIQRPAAIAARTLAAAAQIEERSRHSRSPSSSLSPPPPTPPAERLEEAAYEQEAEKEASPIPTTLKPKRQRKKATPAAKTEEGVDGEATPAPKKKRTRKGKEPPVYVIPPMEQIETDFKGRLGYACLNTMLRTQKPPVFCSRTCRIDTIKNEDKGMPHLKELGRQNMSDLKDIIEWNAKHHIYFMRMSSEMFPFAGHAEYGYSLDYAEKELKEAGETAKRLGVRLTTHPGQFNQLGSPRRPVVENTFRDLEYHNEMMDRMGLDKDSVMIIHGGGVYNDKPTTIERFKKTYQELSQGVKNRLVLENDEMCFSVDDLLPICEELNIPLVLDYHHDWIFPSSQPLSDLMPRILATWTRKGIKPKFHLSEPRRGAVTLMERRAHADRCQNLPSPLPADIDLMIEAKDKEQAVFHLFRRYGLHPVFHDSLRPPALEETTQTAGRKSSKKKTPKKGVKEEDEEDSATATDGTAPSSPMNGNDFEEVKKEDNMLEHGVAPLPEGINAEGQAVVQLDTVEEAKRKGKGKGEAKANGTATPKKKAATPRKRKIKEDENGADGTVEGEEDEKPKPAKKSKTRATKAKKVEEAVVPVAPSVNTTEAAQMDQ
ncbi:uncharacterized protein JCM6883_005302 [Sporobolomyces salmoneus]|uniref:uncharacterized protein n=1 Tax=Sporobolomyces salmoneus TaxID=183962 RepID=UPI00316B9E96